MHLYWLSRSKSDLQMSYVNILKIYIDKWHGIVCFGVLFKNLFKCKYFIIDSNFFDNFTAKTVFFLACGSCFPPFLFVLFLLRSKTRWWGEENKKKVCIYYLFNMKETDWYGCIFILLFMCVMWQLSLSSLKDPLLIFK